MPEQKERLESFCKFKGYEIIDYYQDAGISANGKMISRLLMSVSQNEIERTSERTKIGLAGAKKMDIFLTSHH